MSSRSICSRLPMDWERLIPGHPGAGGRLGTKQDAQNVLTLMQEASAEVKKLVPDRRRRPRCGRRYRRLNLIAARRDYDLSVVPRSGSGSLGARGDDAL